MNTALRLVLLLMITTFFMACNKDNIKIVPSANITTVNHNIFDFDKLDVSSPFNVEVVFSNTEQSMRIEANENLHAVIEVEQVNGKLIIKLRNNTSIRNGNLVLDVFLTTNDIQAIKAEGTAQVHLQNEWSEDQAEVNLTGASLLTGVINSNQLSASLTGASNLSLEGSSDLLEIDATGASSMEGFDFETNELLVDLTGASDVSVTVHEKMTVEATGASTVFYKGDGVVENQNLSGGSRIIKMD